MDLRSCPLRSWCSPPLVRSVQSQRVLATVDWFALCLACENRRFGAGLPRVHPAVPFIPCGHASCSQSPHRRWPASKPALICLCARPVHAFNETGHNDMLHAVQLRLFIPRSNAKHVAGPDPSTSQNPCRLHIPEVQSIGFRQRAAGRERIGGNQHRDRCHRCGQTDASNDGQSGTPRRGATLVAVVNAATSTP